MHTLYRKMPPSLENDQSILQNISTHKGLGLQSQASCKQKALPADAMATCEAGELRFGQKLG